MRLLLKALAGITLATALFLSGCTKQNDGAVVDAPKAQDQKLNVFVSFYPYYEIAKKVGGDQVEITSMIPSGTEPHDYEPSTKQIIALEKSDVFLYNGLELEEWAEKAVENLPKDKIKIIEAGVIISPLKAEEEEQHDPHLWLDPMNMKKVAEKVKDAFVELDVKDKETYDRNYNDFARELEDLHREYQTALAGAKQKDIVVSHDAFGYLTHAYGIHEYPVAGLNPHAEPSASELVKLADFMKEKHMKYVFMETLAAPKTAEVLAREAGVQVLALNPLEGLTQEEEQKGEDYISIMKKNLENLKKALVE